MKLYRERCGVCGRGSPGMHTGEVPPLAEIIRRGPTKISRMDWSIPICSWDCSERFLNGERFVVQASFA